MTILFVIVVGVITGFSAGMFGIGGALLSTPLLKLLVGLDDKLALATPLPATLPAAISGSLVYFRERLLRLDVARWVLLGGVPFNIVGARLVKQMPGWLMMMLTGLVLLYSGLLFLNRSRKSRKLRKLAEVEAPGVIATGNEDEPTASPAEFRTLHLIAIGALAGFTSGFLAIGGGMVMVPAFVSFLRLTTKESLATSLFCVAILSIPGIVVHHLNGYVDWEVALILSAVVIPFSTIGAKVTSRLKTPQIELTYGLVILLFALFFIVQNLFFVR